MVSGRPPAYPLADCRPRALSAVEAAARGARPWARNTGQQSTCGCCSPGPVSALWGRQPWWRVELQRPWSFPWTCLPGPCLRIPNGRRTLVWSRLCLYLSRLFT